MASDLGRALAALRQPKEHVCASCGTTFMAIGDARYCSRPDCQRARKLKWWRRNRSKAARQRQEKGRDDG